MATTYNPAVRQGKAVPTEAGSLKLLREVYTLGSSYASTDINNGDLIQVGVVPAGCKLVPHLSRLSVPAIDSNGAPTGDYTIGSATDPDALKGTAASETAVVLSGEDFDLVNGALGAKAADVPIYVKAIADSATTPTTGSFVADWVIRPYDSAVDSDLT